MSSPECTELSPLPIMIEANPFYLIRGLTRWTLPELPPCDPGRHPESLDSFDAALAAIPASNPECEVVFCDVFDTLLQRNVAPAEVIHEKTNRYLRAFFREGEERPSEAALMATRKEVTETLAARGHESGCHGEYHLADVFSELSNRLLPDDGDAARRLAHACMAYEIRQERRHMSEVPGAAAFLRQLKNNYRVVCLTDTPMDKTTVEALLADAGLSSYIDGLYVSSELGANKRSGSLFDMAMTREKVDAGRIVHLGDHPLSDWVVPRSQGIQALLLQHRSVFSSHANFVQRRSAARIFGCPEYLAPPPDEQKAETQAFRLGRDHFSLTFSLFALQLLELDKEHRFDRIYFVARDGYLPQQALLHFATKLDDPWAEATLAKIDYLHLSRASTLCPMDSEAMDDALNYSTLVHGRNAVPSFFATLGLDTEDYETLLEKEGFTAGDMASASLETLAKLRQRIFSSESVLGKTLREDLARKRRSLHAYLEGKGFFSAEKVLLVDAGWRYRIAHNLEVALGKQAAFPEVHCALLGYTNELPLERTRVHPGFLFDARRSNPLEGLLLRHREIIEAISTAPEGSCTGYTPTATGLSVPVLRAGNYENPTRHEIQQGILAGVDRFASQYDRYQIGEEFQLHAVIQLLLPLLDAGHALHEVITRMALPDANAEILYPLAPVGSEQQSVGSFISRLSDRIEVNLGLGGPTAPPTRPLEKLLGLVQRALSSDKPVILWGMGLVGKLLYPHVADQVAYLVDADSALHGQRYGRHVIGSPDALTNGGGENHLVIFTALTRSRPAQLAELQAEVLFAGDWLA